MEYIRACIRIKPTLGNEDEEIICGKYDETSVVNYKTHEKYNFGKHFLNTMKFMNANDIIRASF